jgi:potassium large conductance calcium-activated channel subfamily M alpha member 1
LKLLLLAVEVKSDDGQDTTIAINPNTQIIIKEKAQGFFVAQSADEAKRSNILAKNA